MAVGTALGVGASRTRRRVLVDVPAGSTSGLNGWQWDCVDRIHAGDAALGGDVAAVVDASLRRELARLAWRRRFAGTLFSPWLTVGRRQWRVRVTTWHRLLHFRLEATSCPSPTTPSTLTQPPAKRRPRQRRLQRRLPKDGRQRRHEQTRPRRPLVIAQRQACPHYVGGLLEMLFLRSPSTQLPVTPRASQLLWHQRQPLR